MLLSTLSVVVKTVGVSEAVAGLTRLDAAGKKSATTMTAAESGMGKASRAAGLLTLGVGAAAAGAVKLAADFQSSMNQLQAVTGASTKTMNAMRKEAIRLGADTKLPATSAKDAAEAMTEMVKAGVSVTDTMGGVRDVLVLSAAAQVSNARAAEIAANAMNTFHLAGKDVKMITDQLANTANASSVEINDVADSFKMAGAVFSGFQGPAIGAKNAMTELNVAIGILGNAGIKGSDAGTSLKQMLLQLTGPSNKAKGAMQALYVVAQGGIATDSQLTGVIQGSSKARDAAVNAITAHNKTLADGGDIAYDAAGKMRSLKDIIALVTAGTKDMSGEEKNAYLTQIFGADATRAVISLMNAGPGAFDKMTAAVTKQGSAQALAQSKMKGFNGAMEGLKSAGETLAITLGTTLLPALTTFVQFLSKVAGLANQEQTATMILVGGLTALALAVWAVNAAMAANPVTLVVLGLVALGAAVVVAYKHFEGFRKVVDAVFAWLREASGKIATVAGAAPDAIAGAWTAATDVIVGEVSQWDTLWSAIKRGFDFILATARLAMAGLKVAFSVGMLILAPIAVAAFTLIKGIFTGAFQAIKGIVSGGLQVVRGVIKIVGGLFKGDFGQIWEGIKTVFRGGITALKGILQGAWTILSAPVKAIGAGIHDAFSNSWDRIKSVFVSSINAVIGFINVLISAVNSIPGVPDIKPIGKIGGGGGGGGKAGSNIPANKLARGGAYGRTGGYVDSPITLMGEEAPRHPEYVIPTNPAYRGRAKGLLGQAAQALGFQAGGKWGVGALEGLWGRAGGGPSLAHTMAIISTAESGVLGRYGNQYAHNPSGATGLWQILGQIVPGNLYDALVNAKNAVAKYAAQGLGAWAASKSAWGPVVGNFPGTRPTGPGSGPINAVVDTAGDIINKLPRPTAAMGVFRGLGSWVLDKAKDYIRDHVAPITDIFTGGPRTPGGGTGLAQPRGALQLPAVFTPTHQTAGLPGYPAVDVFASPGTRVLSPVDGQVTRFSGRSPAAGAYAGLGGPFGWSMYLNGGGRSYFLTHFGSRSVNVGQGVQRGQMIGTVGDYPGGVPDHIHEGATGMARGGIFKYLGAFGGGGFTGAQEGLAYLHKNEAVLPLKKGGTSIRHGKGTVKIPTLPHRGPGPLIVDTRIFGKTPAPRRFTDPIVDTGNGGGSSAANDALIAALERLAQAEEERKVVEEERIRLDTQIAANQTRLITLTTQQGPQLLAGVVAAVNGGIGGRIGLGFQSVSYPGGAARY